MLRRYRANYSITPNFSNKVKTHLRLTHQNNWIWVIDADYGFMRLKLVKLRYEEFIIKYCNKGIAWHWTLGQNKLDRIRKRSGTHLLYNRYS